MPVGSFYEVRGGPVGPPFLLPDNFASARAALDDRFPAASKGIGAALREIEAMSVGLGTLSRGRDAFSDPREGFSALLKLAPMVRGWRLSLEEAFARHFGADEAVKCALAANLAYYHDDPAGLWWIFFAVAQGGYLQSGSYYIRGGSQRLSDALADAIRSAGGDILVGRTATSIGLDAEGRAKCVVHASREGDDEAQVEAPIVVGNAAPGVLASMLPKEARERFLSPYSGLSPSISVRPVHATSRVRHEGVLDLPAPRLDEGARRFSQERRRDAGHARQRGSCDGHRRLFGHRLRSWRAALCRLRCRSRPARQLVGPRSIRVPTQAGTVERGDRRCHRSSVSRF
jgi:phytoene dehydrogenase-like protein